MCELIKPKFPVFVGSQPKEAVGNVYAQKDRVAVPTGHIVDSDALVDESLNNSNLTDKVVREFSLAKWGPTA